MSSVETNTQNRPNPSPSHRVEKKKCGEHDYEVGFYPGFASRIQVNDTEVYKQSETFVLPNGMSKPFSSHAVQIRCSKGYNVVLQVDDPHHVIDQIVVKLRDPEEMASASGGVFANQQRGDTVTVDNEANTCPPNC